MIRGVYINVTAVSQFALEIFSILKITKWIWQSDAHNECVNKYLWSSVVDSVMCYHAVNINIPKSICILLDFLTLASRFSR